MKAYIQSHQNQKPIEQVGSGIGKIRIALLLLKKPQGFDLVHIGFIEAATGLVMDVFI